MNETNAPWPKERKPPVIREPNFCFIRTRNSVPFNQTSFSVYSVVFALMLNFHVENNPRIRPSACANVNEHCRLLLRFARNKESIATIFAYARVCPFAGWKYYFAKHKPERFCTNLWILLFNFLSLSMHIRALTLAKSDESRVTNCSFGMFACTYELKTTRSSSAFATRQTITDKNISFLVAQNYEKANYERAVAWEK